jgi:pyruvate/2-oxoglutarate dehydrogenase complex dihydrolipoamide acyltransferase (E2) component
MKADVWRRVVKAAEKPNRRMVPSAPKYELGQMSPWAPFGSDQTYQIDPHIYFFNDVDMGKLAALREEIISDFEKYEGVRISMNDFFIKAVALTLREYPLLNAMVSGEEIRIFPEINEDWPWPWKTD